MCIARLPAIVASLFAGGEEEIAYCLFSKPDLSILANREIFITPPPPLKYKYLLEFRGGVDINKAEKFSIRVNQI